ncbi:MAG: hypothetical protein KGH71_01570 [Candidatus Micrarchaeota archaeon]|nr:hypothetical protein [Candidatus Micrarchaeota archaeon]
MKFKFWEKGQASAAENSKWYENLPIGRVGEYLDRPLALEYIGLGAKDQKVALKAVELSDNTTTLKNIILNSTDRIVRIHAFQKPQICDSQICLYHLAFASEDNEIATMSTGRIEDPKMLAVIAITANNSQARIAACQLVAVMMSDEKQGQIASASMQRIALEVTDNFVSDMALRAVRDNEQILKEIVVFGKNPRARENAAWHISDKQWLRQTGLRLNQGSEEDQAVASKIGLKFMMLSQE